MSKYTLVKVSTYRYSLVMHKHSHEISSDYNNGEQVITSDEQLLTCDEHVLTNVTRGTGTHI
jgi:hypothetical protein